MFGRHFKKISIILQKKTLNQPTTIIYIDFVIIYKNLVYKFKNSKDILFLDHYIRQ